MSNQPKKKVVEEEKQERVHPFDSFWKHQKQKQDEKETKPSKEDSKRPFWF